MTSFYMNNQLNPNGKPYHLVITGPGGEIYHLALSDEERVELIHTLIGEESTHWLCVSLENSIASAARTVAEIDSTDSEAGDTILDMAQLMIQYTKLQEIFPEPSVMMAEDMENWEG